MGFFRRKCLTVAVVVSLVATAFVGGISPKSKAFADAANPAAGKTIAIKSSTNGKFLRSAGSQALADQLDAPVEELFTVISNADDGTVSFKSARTSQYIVTNGESALQLSSSSTNSRFTMTFLSNGKFNLKAKSNSKYVVLESSSTALKPTASNSNSAEAFTPYYDLPNRMRMLEITESGASDIKSLFPDTDYYIDSMSMKRFVAQRDELDGAYDAVYIGKGISTDNGTYSYNATVAASQNHNTTKIQNDITTLKRDQLADYYVNKGLPLIVYSQGKFGSTAGSGAFYQQTRGLLYPFINGYVQKNASNAAVVSNSFVPVSSKENVYFVGDSDLASASAFLAKTSLLNYKTVRPKLNLAATPMDYTADSAKIYKEGDVLTYRFDIGNVPDITKQKLVAELYIGIDSVLAFGADQLVASMPLTSLSGNELTFRLPAGYSGLHYWKLAVRDLTSKRCDMATGAIRFQNEAPTIQVLQVMPNNRNSSTPNNASALTSSTNMNQTYLKSAGDYAINITTMNITTFNASGYKDLNGKYDMLIFGFGDYYNNDAPIGDDAAAKVLQFINTGQSVMFTHDTILINDNPNNANWKSKFAEASGQNGTFTNMGFGAPETSTTTLQVNGGLLTQFPFNIENITTKVASTHDQYFTLKLEDPNIIPWYNISGGSRDNNDSWNHYYTYSKGNVTYSGTGHTNTGFPDWEQKLFVNTMYRAFIGSNHAPTLIVTSPVAYTAAADNFSSADNDLLITYTPKDLDLNDRQIYTSVDLVYNGKTVAAREKQLSNSGETVSFTYPNPLPNGGDLKVVIKATDKKEAAVTQETPVKLVKIESNVTVNRTNTTQLGDNNTIEKNTPVTFRYTVQPNAIDYRTGLDPAKLVISNVHFKETFPANVDVSNYPSELSRTGTLSGGYTLEGTFSNLSYLRVGNYYVANQKAFTVNVTPKANGSYVMNQSTLAFNDLVLSGTGTNPKTLIFPPVSITAVTKLTKLSLKDMMINKGDTSRMNPAYEPVDATNTNFLWSSSNSSVVSVDANGNITGVEQGSAVITARATDGSGLSASATVQVINAGLNISGPTAVNVGESIGLEAILVSADEKISSYSWSLSDTALARLSGGTSSRCTVEGLKYGTVTLRASVITDKGKTYTASVPISVLNPVKEVSISGPDSVKVGNTITLAAVIKPTDAVHDGFSWQVIGGSTGSASTGATNGQSLSLTGTAAGTVTVKVTVGGITATKTITVSPAVESVSISGPDRMKLGETITLTAILTPDKAAYDSIGWQVTTGSPGKATTGVTNRLSLSLTGTEVGSVTVKVTVDGKTASKTITIDPIVEKIDISGPSEVKLGQQIDLSAEVLPIDATYDSITWQITNGTTGVASGSPSNKGETFTLTGTKPGTVKVTATVGSITSEEKTIEIKLGLMFNTPTITIAKGSGENLINRLSSDPPNALGSVQQDLVWTSSNPAIVTVNGGDIKGIKQGTAVITVYYRGLYSSTKTSITVKVSDENRY